MREIDGPMETRDLRYYILYLHKNCRQRCFLYALKRVRDRETAAELVASAFSKVVFKNPNFSSIENAEGYLFVTLRNTCNDYFKTSFTEMLDPKLEIASPPEVYTRIEAYELQLSYEGILEKLAKILAPAERTILHLKYIENLSNREIAARMNRGEDGIKAQKYTAVQKIRKQYPEFIKAWREIASVMVLFILIN